MGVSQGHHRSGRNGRADRSEGGLRGGRTRRANRPEPLGSYRYRKWGTELEVTVYLMEVTSADDRWDEDDFRDRRWCDAVTADQLLHRDELREMLAAAVERLDHH